MPGGYRQNGLRGSGRSSPERRPWARRAGRRGGRTRAEGRRASRLVLLREMAADLGRRQAEAAERDLVPGLEAAGVAVQVEDRRLDRVRVLALDGAQPAAARRALDRSRVPFFMTSISWWWRWPARTSGTSPSVSRAATGLVGDRDVDRGARAPAGRAGPRPGGRPPASCAASPPGVDRAVRGELGVADAREAQARDRHRPAVVEDVHVLQALQIALRDAASRGCRGPRRRARRGRGSGPGSRSRRPCRGPSCRRSRRSRRSRTAPRARR